MKETQLERFIQELRNANNKIRSLDTRDKNELKDFGVRIECLQGLLAIVLRTALLGQIVKQATKEEKETLAVDKEILAIDEELWDEA